MGFIDGHLIGVRRSPDMAVGIVARAERQASVRLFQYEASKVG